MDHDENQGVLFILPLTNGDGSARRDAARSMMSAYEKEYAGAGMPEAISCELTLSYRGITTTKRYTLPFGWLLTPEAALICAAYAESAQEDLAPLVR